eukprot:CAMPEP_0183308066 /NCGR_PEP_ID=MMETSP0160_2-20130417/19725_1 /TAXON_ID=2839 ORGANISM="Odontella Sinensis, Strain Grunow 1884" /NCGR_SAMPLE_ID=MMETSP0160_2 /ASSEMBLY_ACC=CAM_ASM_000250 /LENGTH=92 /DNA_ID=CAMNT_0025471811 /DNA_START=22 /DNA_END=300 /DNA_ORIENTATION=-
MWLHAPSFLVGSATAGAGFLLIHRETSRRGRVSDRWLLAEKVEARLLEVWSGAADEAKKAAVNKAPTDFAAKTTSAWNGGVEAVRDLLKKVD